MKTIDLCGKWEGKCILPDGSSFDFIGNIPGSAINDLIFAEKLPKDIFWRDNADSVSEYEKCNYVYKKSFEFTVEHKDAIISFERIDTYADIYLNGQKIYHSENGNIRHDINVSGKLLHGINTIEARLYSPSEWVKDLPLRPGAFTKERLYTRRMQCTYSWDWVARFLTCGLGKCALLLWDEFEIFPENVYIATTDVDSESATVLVDITFPFEYNGRVLEFLLRSPDGSVACKILKYCEEKLVRIHMDVPEPHLWYPIGYGEQPLYTLEVIYEDKVLYSENIGIRTAKIMQLPDAENSKNYKLCLSIKNKQYDRNDDFSGFVLKINGQKVFCRGANWVPCVPFDIGNIEARQTEVLELCAEAGVNMLRVWGGGAFESRHFYNECSRLGILVTQDFLMACGSYPEEQDWFIEELNKEALYAARLIRNQPCLVWWSGDNENAVRGCDTDANYHGRRSAYSGIAPILYKEDPYRRFLPSSPYGGKLYASNTVGTTHNTQFLDRIFAYFFKDDLSDYKDELKKYRARFIAEEPQLGAVSLPTLRRFMSDDDIFCGNEMWHFHTKDNPSLKFSLFDCILHISETLLGTFVDPHDKLFKLQYIQYEWIRVLMEQARREKEFCSGIIFWMMNDCWPASAGWSLIDYYNLPKNGFYSFKRCAKPVLASIDRENGVYRIYVINDGTTKKADIKIRILSEDRETAKEYLSTSVVLAPTSSHVVFEAKDVIADKEVLIFDVNGEFGKDRAFYYNGNLEICPTDVEYITDKEKKTVKITAKDKYIHAVTISGNIVLDDNCFSLLPHETREISYRIIAANGDDSITVTAYTLA